MVRSYLVPAIILAMTVDSFAAPVVESRQSASKSSVSCKPYKAGDWKESGRAHINFYYAVSLVDGF